MAALAFLFPLMLRAAPVLLIIVVYFATPLSTAGIVLVLHAILLRLSFSSDFERLERKLDVFFFGSGGSKEGVEQYERLHFTAFGVPRPEPMSHQDVEMQKLRTSAFSIFDIVSPLIWLALVGHYIFALVTRGAA